MAQRATTCRRIHVSLKETEGLVSYRDLCRSSTDGTGVHQQDATRGGTTALAQVIQRISEMYAPEEDVSSEDEQMEDDKKVDSTEEGSKKRRKKNKRSARSDPDDWYDIDDTFIDDADQDAYFSKENRKTKHGGFYINKGSIENADTDCTDREVATPKKRKTTVKKGETKATGLHRVDKTNGAGAKSSNGTIKKKKILPKEKRFREMLCNQPYNLSSTMLQLIGAVREETTLGGKPDEDAKRKRLPKTVIEKLKPVAAQCTSECPLGARQREVIQVLMTFLEPFTTEVNLISKMKQLANEHKLVQNQVNVEKQEGELKDMVENKLKGMSPEDFVAASAQSTGEGQPCTTESEDQVKHGEKLFDREMENLLLSIWSSVCQREDRFKEVSALYKRICAFWPEGSMDAKTLQKVLKRAKARRDKHGPPSGLTKRRKTAVPVTPDGSQAVSDDNPQQPTKVGPSQEIVGGGIPDTNNTTNKELATTTEEGTLEC